MTQTPRELISALRQEVTEDGHILLDRLEAQLFEGEFFWPGEVMDVAVSVLGPAIYNPASRNRKTLGKLIEHALTVWRTRYGPLNLAQDKYASDLLCSAFTEGAKSASGARLDSPIAPIITRLKLLVNHDTVDGGFKRRRDTVDVSRLLRSELA